MQQRDGSNESEQTERKSYSHISISSSVSVSKEEGDDKSHLNYTVHGNVTNFRQATPRENETEQLLVYDRSTESVFEEDDVSDQNSVAQESFLDDVNDVETDQPYV